MRAVGDDRHKKNYYYYDRDAIVVDLESLRRNFPCRICYVSKKIKKTDNYSEYIEYITDRPFNDKRYYISNEKIKNLGWDITENFDKGIDSLVKMYNNN